jgi:hypothetical protein
MTAIYRRVEPHIGPRPQLARNAAETIRHGYRQRQSENNGPRCNTAAVAGPLARRLRDVYRWVVITDGRTGSGRGRSGNQRLSPGGRSAAWANTERHVTRRTVEAEEGPDRRPRPPGGRRQSQTRPAHRTRETLANRRLTDDTAAADELTARRISHARGAVQLPNSGIH